MASNKEEKSFFVKYGFWLVITVFFVFLLWLASSVDKFTLLMLIIGFLFGVVIYKWVLNHVFLNVFQIIERVRRQIAVYDGVDVAEKCDVTTAEVKEYPPHTNCFLVYFWSNNWLYVFDNKIGSIIHKKQESISDYVKNYNKGILAHDITKKSFDENVFAEKERVEQDTN